MGYHGVHLLRFAVELDGLTTLLVAAGASFFVFLWPMCGVLLGLFLEYYAL